MCNRTTDAHLQIKREEFTFVATTNALNPCSDDCLVANSIHIDNQKEKTILGNANTLTEALTFECIMHEKFIVCTNQTILETNIQLVVYKIIIRSR